MMWRSCGKHTSRTTEKARRVNDCFNRVGEGSCVASCGCGGREVCVGVEDIDEEAVRVGRKAGKGR